LENKQSVRAAQQWVASTLGMGHEAEDVSLLIANSRNAVSRSVGIRGLRCAAALVAVTKQDAAFEFEPMEDDVIRKVAPLAMSDRKAQNGSRPCGICERAVMAIDTHVYVLANEV
jgi:hypothetical protein